jgi:beta-N-acetylglucosaminidase
MKRHLLKQTMVVALAAILSFEMPGALPASFPDASGYEAKSSSVKASSLNVRSGPGTSYSCVTSLSHGTKVTITDEKTGSDGSTWCSITFSGGEGYVKKSYLKNDVSYQTDDNFEAELSGQGFPETYKKGLREIHAEYPNWVFKAENTGLDWEEVIANESTVGSNLVYKTSKSSWKSTAEGAYDWKNNYWPGFDSSAWVAASESIIRYYMDPRNFLDSAYVFQFLLQSYDPATNVASGVETLAKDTFLAGKASGSSTASGNTSSAVQSTTQAAPASQSSGKAVLEGPTASITMNTGSVHAATIVKGPGSAITAPGLSSSPVSSGNTGDSGQSADTSALGGKSYIDIIMDAAEKSGVNPYVLTSMIIQEQGTKGTNGLVNGKTSGYEGIYNFFNIQAYATDNMTAVQRGLWWASQSGSYGRPWNSIEKAIVGGAECYGENFVKSGQDTFYLKKFNVQGTNLYKHEYMTNVEGAASEGYKLGEAYSDDLKKTALTFRIPVFNNMPDTPQAVPDGDGSPNNKLSSLSVEGFSITPSFDMNTADYSLIVDSGVSSVKISAKAIDSAASIDGTGNIDLSSGDITAAVNVKAENGNVRTYNIHIVKQNGGSAGNAAPDSTSSGTVVKVTKQDTAKTSPSKNSSGDTAVLIGPSGQ